MKLIHTLVIASIAIVGLSACGGGSDGGSTPTPLTLVTLDSGNATMVAGTASTAVFGTAEIGGLTDLTGSTSNAQGGVTKRDASAVAAKAAQGTLSNVRFALFSADTSFCVVSGSVTVLSDLASPFTFTAGDFISADFDMCDDGEGETIDGMLEMTITSFEGDVLTSEFLFGVDLLMTEFMVITLTDTMMADGDIGTTVDTRTPPIVEGSIFGDSFVISGMGVTETISMFSTLYTEDSSTFPVSWTNNSMGTVDSSEVSGAVRYETPLAFEGSGANYPHTGQLLVTGAKGATLLLRTIDDVNIEIDADYDGDGSVDETLVLTWAELENQI